MSVCYSQVPVQPPRAAEEVGAEHRPGPLRAQAAHRHLLRALPPRVLQRLRQPQEPEAQRGAHGVRLPGRGPAPCLLQLVREDTDTASKSGNADSEKEKVLPEAREHSPGRKTDTALEALQPPPSTGSPEGQVLPHRPEAAEAPGQPTSPPQPSDHSYALLDLDTLKKKLFVTLKENEKLRKRLKAQRLVIRRVCSSLRAHREGQGPQAGPQPEQQS
ncbi:THAP domain-containing protein 3 isoform X3 [Molossus molossus]|uniref:THAP domain-containing protein 3 isoform X3 n=1 Tax=Molossus molossus TaxID=27622 RepID=UPI001746BD6E|nr:THAP domain-containing protein 3 isoform X3 [Molossus molossus]